MNIAICLLCALAGAAIGYIACYLLNEKVRVVELSDVMEHKEKLSGNRLRLQGALQLQNELANCTALKIGDEVDGKRKVSIKVVL